MSDTVKATETPMHTVGDSLRDARTAANLGVSEVASKLNLTISAVESLEANQFERLPGNTFARGYIRSYAKILGLDADQLARTFDQQVGSSAAQGAVHSIDRVGEARSVSRGMLQFSAFVILLIILTAAYYAWQTFMVEQPEIGNKTAVFERVEVERADGSVHVQTLDELEDQAVAFALEANSAAEVLTLEVESGNDTDVEQPSASATDSETTDADARLPDQGALAEPDSATSQSQTAAESVTLAPGMGNAELSFVHDCWVRVADADGKEISSGLKRAGEQLNITGKAPLDVHLGYAKGVSILYNGEPVDFSAAVRGETARIKLGQ